MGDRDLVAEVEASARGRDIILRALVGSTAHGVNVPDGLEDRDELAVCIEPFEECCGLPAPYEVSVLRTAALREGQHDAKSRAGDLDLTVFSLRKYLRLALKGNPTVLVPLFSSEWTGDARGAQLRELAPKIVSRRAGGAFLGYFTAQRQRLVGERGQKDVNRPELVARHGFDTKYAMHVLRLGLQGVELLRTGRLTLPMAAAERALLLDVREGRRTLQDVLTFAGELEQALRDARDTSPLPEHPDEAAVEAWMLAAYWSTWSAGPYAMAYQSAFHRMAAAAGRREPDGQEAIW